MLREAWGGNLDHRACTIIGCQDLLICFEFLTRRKCSSLCRYKHLTSARLVYGTTLYTMMVSTIYFEPVSRLSTRRHFTSVTVHCLTSMSVCEELYTSSIEHDLQLGVRERKRISDSCQGRPNYLESDRNRVSTTKGLESLKILSIRRRRRSLRRSGGRASRFAQCKILNAEAIFSEVPELSPRQHSSHLCLTCPLVHPKFLYPMFCESRRDSMNCVVVLDCRAFLAV